MSETPYVEANVERFMGFAQHYDAYRPSMPPVIVDMLAQLARVCRPRLVVDPGSGTGLSIRAWMGRADEVIGIEPSDDMRRQAEARSADLASVRYQKGFSTATGLPDGCADIITAVQSLHWMEPTGTFAEVGRLLRPGGVFAAIDSDWPPTFDWEAQTLYEAFMMNAGKLAAAGQYDRDVKSWAKHEHLDRISASGRFRYATEVAAHHVEQGNAERLVGLALSQGVVQTLFKAGLTQEQVGVPAFRT